MAGSPALLQGARVLMAPVALGSQQAAPRPIPRKDPGIPVPNRTPVPGLNLAPTVAHAVATAALAPVRDLTAGVLAAGPTAENVATGATVAHRCLIAAGISAIAQIQIRMLAWEFLA